METAAAILNESYVDQWGTTRLYYSILVDWEVGWNEEDSTWNMLVGELSACLSDFLIGEVCCVESYLEVIEIDNMTELLWKACNRDVEGAIWPFLDVALLAQVFTPPIARLHLPGSELIVVNLNDFT